MPKRSLPKIDVGLSRVAAAPGSDAQVSASSQPPWTFDAAIAYLMSRVDVERTHPARVDPNAFKFDRTAALMAAIGNPHISFRSIHVAGSKGKGSVCEMSAAALRGCGYTVGLYTSPHLVDIRERIRIQGEMIGHAEFAEVAARVVAAGGIIAREHGEPTFFELMTAIAFLYFAEQAVDLAVVEVGLGGRLDCTNVISPEISIITAIQLEHTQLLGDTIEKIATEKAGIIKPRTPVITFAQQAPDALAVFRRTAAEREAPLVIVGTDPELAWRSETGRDGTPQIRVSVSPARSGPQASARSQISSDPPSSATPPTPGGFEHVTVPLRGEHQAVNCGMVLAALDLLRARGMRIDTRDAVAGLAQTPNAGRLEIVQREPLVIVDGAHNPESIENLIKSLAALGRHESLVVIFGCAADKNVAGMLSKLALGADKVIFTRASGSSRALDPEELRRRYAEITSKPSLVAPTVAEALSLAHRAAPSDSLICATGSFYIAGETKHLLQSKRAAAGTKTEPGSPRSPGSGPAPRSPAPVTHPS